MTIEEIKAIPIAAFLARMGYEPARRRGDEYWYLAPYREERTASFQVNVRKEIWHDFGTGQGGDIFNLPGSLSAAGISSAGQVHHRDMGRSRSRAQDRFLH